MNTGIAKKVISVCFLFVNFIQPAKSDEHKRINKSRNLISQLSSLKISNKKIPLNSSNLFLNHFKEFEVERNFLKKHSEDLMADTSQQKQELVIQSDKQSEINDVIFAEGKVTVSYKGKFLKADKLIYDKLNKKIFAQGNIALILREQIFTASQLEYSFISEKGNLLDVKGFINTNTLIDDLSFDFTLSDFSKVEKLLDLKKKEVINTPSKVENWLFFTDKMTIDGNKWKSKKVVFSNDLLEFKQAKLAINSLEVISEAEKLRFKSSLNYLIIEDKLSIPFWFGDRTLAKSGEFLDLVNRWNLGYDNLDKDGYFIGRKFDSIDIFDDFVFDLEPQFLIQRSIKGYTKSFVKEDESITSKKIKRNAGFEDYFALRSQIKGSIGNWNLEIDKNLNSLDLNKFSDALRFKTELSKEIDLLDSKWEKSFYGIYRERVWNGSLGEAEIYSGYG